MKSEMELEARKQSEEGPLGTNQRQLPVFLSASVRVLWVVVGLPHHPGILESVQWRMMSMMMTPSHQILIMTDCLVIHLPSRNRRRDQLRKTRRPRAKRRVRKKTQREKGQKGWQGQKGQVTIEFEKCFTTPSPQIVMAKHIFLLTGCREETARSDYL